MPWPRTGVARCPVRTPSVLAAGTPEAQRAGDPARPLALPRAPDGADAPLRTPRAGDIAPARALDGARAQPRWQRAGGIVPARAPCGDDADEEDSVDLGGRR